MWYLIGFASLSNSTRIVFLLQELQIIFWVSMSKSLFKSPSQQIEKIKLIVSYIYTVPTEQVKDKPGS